MPAYYKQSAKYTFLFLNTRKYKRARVYLGLGGVWGEGGGVMKYTGYTRSTVGTIACIHT